MKAIPQKLNCFINYRACTRLQSSMHISVAPVNLTYTCPDC